MTASPTCGDVPKPSSSLVPQLRTRGLRARSYAASRSGRYGHAAVDAWTKIGAIAAVVAAVGAIIGVAVSWWYGKRTVGDSQKAVMYDRLREARELVGRIRLRADNTQWNDVTEAAAQLRSVLASIDAVLPHTRRLSEEPEWDLSTYPTIVEHVQAARDELEQATRQLLR